MKKSLFLAMAAVVLLSGCSKDDGGIISDGGNGNEGGDNENTPVQIQLGTNLVTSNTTQTRAAIEAWANTKVGILGLAKNAVDPWDITTYGTTCIMTNIGGTIVSNTDKQTITFTDSHYYPLDNSINYSFYGYYPYADGTDVTIGATDNVVTVTYPKFDGTQDILCGSIKATKLAAADSKDGKEYDGFNARYFRKMKTKTTPDIVFNHKLVRLVFNISGGEGNITDLQVKSIKLIKVPTELSLVVADKANEANEGTITYVEPQAPFTNNFYTLKDAATGTDAAAVNLHDGTNPVTAQKMGESIMVPAAVAAGNAGNYAAEIQLGFINGTQTISPSPITITPPSGKTFTAGNSYNVNITIHGLTEIEVTATLTPWVDGGSSDIEIN